MAISEQKLEFWADNNYNVIFSGKHGVGKTQIITTLFNEKFGEQGVDWLYFSAPTMDPWVDFVGVPKEVTDGNGVAHLELVRPKAFALDTVKAIFFDEYNRSPSKIRNAVMELMQFKSINGYKFNNLRIIWAAINPPDEDDDEMGYNVEQIDPAQLDRFHVIKELPYAVSKKYFTQKYGEDAGIAACDWWNSLTKKNKEKISPRRLDYVIDCWSKKGDIKDILPDGTISKQLLEQLSFGSYNRELKAIIKGKRAEDKIEKTLADEGFFSYVESKLKDHDVFKKLFPYLEDEKKMKVISSFSAKQITASLKSLDYNDEIAKLFREAMEIDSKWLTVPKKKAIGVWIAENDSDKIRTLDNPNKNIPNKGVKRNEAEKILTRVCSNDINYENTFGREERMRCLIHDFEDNHSNIEWLLDSGEVSKQAINNFFTALGIIAMRSTSPKRKEYGDKFYKSKNAVKVLRKLIIYANTYCPDTMVKEMNEKFNDLLDKCLKEKIVMTNNGLWMI